MDSIRILPSIAEVIRKRAAAQGLSDSDLHDLMIVMGGSSSWRGGGGVCRRNVDAIAAALGTNWLNICTEAEELEKMADMFLVIEQKQDEQAHGIFAVIGKLFDFIVGNKRG